MKLTEIIFTNPISVLQVFRNINTYGKDLRSFESRREQNEWKEMISHSGYILNNQLFLPERIVENPAFKNCTLITLEDENLPEDNISGRKKNPVIHNQYYQQWKNTKLYIFNLKKKNNIEVHLQYGYFEIGIPERDNFKICELKLNSPVEIKINGKMDATLSSRLDRLFKEQKYILIYHGEFDRCTLLKDASSNIKKQVPEQRKLIDLLKPLW